MTEEGGVEGHAFACVAEGHCEKDLFGCAKQNFHINPQRKVIVKAQQENIATPPLSKVCPQMCHVCGEAGEYARKLLKVA